MGGIDIPHDMKLAGHSDADVLLHAVTDALLGAAGLGDIGEMFPDTDPANRGRDSAEMLRQALDSVVQAGWLVGNLDCIVFAQRPKLSPFKQAIRQRVADILEIHPNQIGLKAKTGEHVGPVGQEEVIAAQCVALLKGSIQQSPGARSQSADPNGVQTTEPRVAQRTLGQQGRQNER